MRSCNHGPLKPYVLRRPDGGVAAGTLTFAYQAPKTGDWIEVINECGKFTNPASYTSTVKVTYPSAVSAKDFGIYGQLFLANLGYQANNMVTSISACADDLNGPSFIDVDNIGQSPLSMNKYLGPFYSGGLAGYPHTGITGLAAFASHVTNTGALFVINMPHIGISQSGVVGQSLRRGQTTLNTSCGAVSAAISWALANSGTPTFPSTAFPVNDYQQYFLTNIIAQSASRTALGIVGTPGGSPTPAQMVIATELIRANGETFLLGASGISAISGNTKDVIFCSGTFINVDDGYDAYVNINTFKKWTAAGGWVDLTTSFNSGLH